MAAIDDMVPPADLYITGELARRMPKTTDYLKQTRALQELAARMAHAPEEVLPHFVELAMEMTGGVSAGLSLYEENPAPGIFRWRYLIGTLAPFENATTPRDFSPCGITLDHNGPVLSFHPERFYNWISDANIVVPEVLLVPLYIGSAEPLGTLWIVSEKEGHFDAGHARAMSELAAFLGNALHILSTGQKLKAALEAQETLAREMGHRIKNLFAVTDGMIRLSARDAGSKDEMAQILSGRLHALASAHSLIRKNFSDVTSAAPDLSSLLKALSSPHEGPGSQTPRFTFDGPVLPLGEHGLQGMALVFHEMMTNAAKYGALKAENGRVAVSWSVVGDKLVLRWSEAGGPSITQAPSTSGFGSALLQMTVNRQFKGVAVHDWKREGLIVTLTLPADALAN